MKRIALRTPTAFRPPAQGCEARATLGNGRHKSTTPTGLWPGLDVVRYGRGQNPVGVHGIVGWLTQGSLRRVAAAATLGCRPERRWRSAAPDEILKSLAKVETEIQQGIKELEGMLR